MRGEFSKMHDHIESAKERTNPQLLPLLRREFHMMHEHIDYVSRKIQQEFERELEIQKRQLVNECKWIRGQVAPNMTIEFKHFKDKIGKEFHNTMAQQWGILEKNFFKDCEGNRAQFKENVEKLNEKFAALREEQRARFKNDVKKLSKKFVALEKEQIETITKAEFEKILGIVNNKIYNILLKQSVFSSKIDTIFSQQRTGMNRDTKAVESEGSEGCSGSEEETDSEKDQDGKEERAALSKSATTSAPELAEVMSNQRGM